LRAHEKNYRVILRYSLHYGVIITAASLFAYTNNAVCTFTSDITQNIEHLFSRPTR